MLSFEANTFDGGHSCTLDLCSLFSIWSHTLLPVRDTHNRWTFLWRWRLNFPFVSLSNSTIEITVENTQNNRSQQTGRVWECVWFSLVVSVWRRFSAVDLPRSGLCPIFYTNKLSDSVPRWCTAQNSCTCALAARWKALPALLLPGVVWWKTKANPNRKPPFDSGVSGCWDHQRGKVLLALSSDHISADLSPSVRFSTLTGFSATLIIHICISARCSAESPVRQVTHI